MTKLFMLGKAETSHHRIIFAAMLHELHPELWVGNYADYLYSFALYRINDKQQAEDLVQETFLSAFKTKHQYLGKASEKTWLTSILKNKIIDYYRKQSTVKKNVSSMDVGEFFNDEDGHWIQQAIPKDMSLTAPEIIQQKELRSMLSKCFDSLPANWSGVCKMKLVDEEETDLICKTFDITPSNFWVIMHRAKLQLRACIEKKWNHV